MSRYAVSGKLDFSANSSTGDSAKAQDAAFSIHEGNRAATAACVAIARVKANKSRLRSQVAKINRLISFRTYDHR